jgi:hypothetical protein
MKLTKLKILNAMEDIEFFEDAPSVHCSSSKVGRSGSRFADRSGDPLFFVGGEPEVLST